MKKVIIIIGSLALATTIGVLIYKNMPGAAPTLVDYDPLNKLAHYKYKGKTTILNLQAGESSQAGPYKIEGIVNQVNVANVPIGAIIGVQITKDGVVIQKMVS